LKKNFSFGMPKSYYCREKPMALHHWVLESNALLHLNQVRSPQGAEQYRFAPFRKKKQ
tara:strand:+ start:19499 stop:19672 length:174 start_codon:yes stop_codon:yes gene_type:complete